MKFFKKMTVLTVALAGTTLGVVGCKSTAKMPVTFVAATSSTYNAEVQFGNYDYKFRGKVDHSSNKFTLEGLVQQRHLNASGGSGGQQGGGGKGGGGQQQEKPEPTSFAFDIAKFDVFINEQINANLQVQPMGADTDAEWTSSNPDVLTVDDGTITPVGVGTATITAKSKKNPSVVVTSDPINVSEEDLAAHNWVVNGTWTLDQGYGYVLSLQDQGKTVIHADFDKIQGRHQFYYTVEIEEQKQTLLFQAKDPTFKNSLAKDYKTWDQRDSKYIYYAKATGNNNSVATAYLYLHNDGSAVINAPKSGSADRTTSFGYTWSEANGVVTFKDGDREFVSVASVNSAHPGSLLKTNDYTFLRSDNPEVKWKKMVITDFEGASTHEYKGSYTTTGPDGKTNEVALYLFENGAAKIYENGSFSALEEGTWEEDGIVSVKLGNAVLFENADHSIDYTISVTTSKGSNRYDVNFARTK